MKNHGPCCRGGAAGSSKHAPHGHMRTEETEGFQKPRLMRTRQDQRRGEAGRGKNTRLSAGWGRGFRKPRPLYRCHITPHMQKCGRRRKGVLRNHASYGGCKKESSSKYTLHRPEKKRSDTTFYTILYGRLSYDVIL